MKKERKIAITAIWIGAVLTAMMALFLFIQDPVLADSGEAGAEEGSIPLKDGVYQIGSPNQLAMFSNLVNQGKVTKEDAVLIADIDLDDETYTPIGKDYSHPYQGDFDGQGHVISGLKVKNSSYAGLFGHVKDAVIQNVEVEGTVESDYNSVAGLVAYAEGKVSITNCGNRADVTGIGNSSCAGGILGKSNDRGIAIENCYNRGSISSKYRASGIAADISGSKITNCYNTGEIAGKPAIGVGSGGTNTYTNCYNAGKITAVSGGNAYSVGGTEHSTYINCYCMENLAANDKENWGEQVTSADLKKIDFISKLGSENWKPDAGQSLNRGYPVLKWEKSESTGPVKLEMPTGLTWTGEGPKEETDYGILQGKASVKWNEVSGAEKYKVELYGSDGEVLAEAETEETEYDFSENLKSLDLESAQKLRFCVTAIGDGTYYSNGEPSQLVESDFTWYPELSIDAPSDVTWSAQGKSGCWKAVEGADFYIVSLYRDGSLLREYQLEKKLIKDKESLSISFIKDVAQSGNYYFTVRAGRNITQEGQYKGKDAVSPAVKSQEHTSSQLNETVKIGSVEDWLAVVNTEAKGSGYTTDTQAQQIAWSKNYELTADLDFSELTTRQQNMIKSWGNVTVGFTGIFDGKGHKIKGLNLSGNDSGLFAYVEKGGTVKNLIIEKANVNYSDNAAVFCYRSYGTIQNCGVVNCNINADQGAVIGGFISRNYGTVEDCYVQGGKLTARSTSANGHAGFVGNNTGTVRRSWTSMDVDTSSYCAGGFAGWVDERDEAGKFEDCAAFGNVSAVNGWSGGFVGRVNTSQAKFINCYAANHITSSKKSDRAYGFTGSMGGEGMNDLLGQRSSGFNISLPRENYINCWYASDLTADDNPASGAQAKSSSDMKTDSFKDLLGSAWTRNDGKADGLPYIRDIPAPELESKQTKLKVEIAVVLYDKDDFAFKQEGKTISLTMDSTGNTRVIDVMEAAEAQRLLSYEYTVTPAYGSFIESINGHEMTAPDGWMFTVNDKLSNVSVTMAPVKNGDKILWYQGTTQNLFAAPKWQEITGEAVPLDYMPITTKEELIALTASGADLTKSYKLMNDIDLTGVDFAGIGSKDRPFAGTFDGGGHTITGLKINRPEDHNVGMFNFIRGAVIKNLTLKNIDVTGKYSVGGLAGVAAVKIDKDNAADCVANSIGNCHVTGKVTSANTDTSGSSEGAYVGGLIGWNDGDSDSKSGISISSSVDSCTADVEVNASAAYAGGFCGGNFGYITNSKESGKVKGGISAGGFAGGTEGGIYSCSASGSVSGTSIVGGFTGSAAVGTIKDCYTTSPVKGTQDKIGGFLGSGGTKLESCISSGTVTKDQGNSYVGGFAGYYSGNLIGLKHNIDLKNSYGWCTAEDGSRLPALGNKTSATEESEKDALAAITITDREEMKQKYKTLFNAYLDDSGSVTTCGTATENAALAQKIAANLENQLKDQLSKEKKKEGSGFDGQTPWMIADLVSYQDVTGNTVSIDKELKQSYVNYIGTAVLEKSDKGEYIAGAGDLSKYILSLRALGYDPSKLTFADGESRNLESMLREKAAGEKFAEVDIYTKPYVLIALSQNEGYASDEELLKMARNMVSSALQKGGWNASGSNGKDPSADITGPNLLAIAPWKSDSSVGNAVSNTLKQETITAMMDSTGAMGYDGKGTPESTALMISGIAAAGGDPSSYVKNEKSLYDGLLQFLNDQKNGFRHDGGSALIATEQGFRAVLAVEILEKAGESGKETGRLYDFTNKEIETPKVESKAGDASELDNAKKEAKAELAKIDKNQYREAEQKTLKEEIKKAEKAIDAAKDKAAVNKALEDAKAEIGKIKTDAELTAAEKAARDKAIAAKIAKAKKLKVKKFKIKAKKGAKTVRFTWKKTKGASGYQIQYRISKKGTKYKTLKNTRKLKCSTSKLKKNRKYKVRIRAYQKIQGKKVYGKWNTKNLKKKAR